MKIRTLIVDDEPVAREILRGFCDRAPAISLAGEASGGVEALKIIEREEIDLILLDIMMPGVYGWDLFAKLKEIPMIREVPIVFLTAKTDEFSQGFGKLSAHDYITKPFDINELKQRIEKIFAI